MKNRIETEPPQNIIVTKSTPVTKRQV